MTKREYVERNIGMTFDFIKYVIDHPETIESLPNGAELDFIDKDLPFKLKKGTKRGRIAKYKVEHVFGPISGEMP
jgi:hypothetical protein